MQPDVTTRHSNNANNANNFSYKKCCLDITLFACRIGPLLPVQVRLRLYPHLRTHCQSQPNPLGLIFPVH